MVQGEIPAPKAHPRRGRSTGRDPVSGCPVTVVPPVVTCATQLGFGVRERREHEREGIGVHAHATAIGTRAPRARERVWLRNGTSSYVQSRVNRRCRLFVPQGGTSPVGEEADCDPRGGSSLVATSNEQLRAVPSRAPEETRITPPSETQT